MSSQEKLLNILLACPHGVLEMSNRMKDMVETSTNLASVKFIENGKVQITTSQRSELESRKTMAAQMVRSVFEFVITSYSIHYTKLYEPLIPRHHLSPFRHSHNRLSILSLKVQVTRQTGHD